MKKKIFSMLVALSMAASMIVTPVSAAALTEGYYTYTVTDGAATITDCDTSISGDVVIPATLGGYPVTTIGQSAFDSCSNIKNLEISEGIETIKAFAFNKCSSLENVYIGSSLKSAPNVIFTNCSSLLNIDIDENNETFYSLDGAMFSKYNVLFQYPTNNPRASYAVPEGTIALNERCFSYANNLKEITLPDSIIRISYRALYNCDSLEAFTIPDGVTTLGDEAFYDCDALKKVKMGSGFMYVGKNEFYGCDALESVVIPADVVSIGEGAFAECASLSQVNFEGTKEQWAAITINANNTPLTMASITYDYVEPTEPVTYTVTYDMNGGTYVDKETDTVTEGDYADLSVTASCDGMQFMGWNTDPTAAEPLTEYIVTGDTTLYALWYVPTPEYYMVNYNPNGGDWVEMEAESLPEGATPNFSVSATREGYTHIGWNTDPNATEGLTEYYITGDTVLYAIWQYNAPEPVTYTVYYDANGGDWVEVESETLSADGYVNLDYQATREGYTFLGWNTDPDATEALTEISSFVDGLTLYAIWEEIVEPSPEPTEEPTPEPSEEPLTPPTPSDDDFNNSSKADAATEYTITVSSSGTDYVWYAFAPEETKAYSFYTTGSYYDTRGFLYNSAKECIAQDDNSGDYSNFKITKTLTAGEVYYIAIEVVGGGQAGITGMPNSFGFKIDEEAETEQMEVSVSDVKGLGGNMVEVDVVVSNNTGITNLGLEFDYDETVMTLTDVQYDSTVGATVTTAESFDVKPYNISFDSTQNFDFNGNLIKLIFTLNEDISVGKYPVTVDYYKGQDGTFEDGEDVNYDENFAPVSIKYTSGSIVVYTPGDIYNDNKINNKDATYMLRYLADWDIEELENIVTYALDTDGSGYVNEYDATHLLRYIAGWGNELH